jgi:hypothetical protein
VTDAARHGRGARSTLARVTRLAALLAALALALPATAFAQGAGDDQYQDPFGDETAQAEPGGSGSGGAGGLSEQPPVPPDSGDGGSQEPAPAPAPEPAPAPAPEEAAPAPAGTGDQLPDTGADPRGLVLVGIAFVLAGVGLRLRTVDPDAF